MCVHHWLLTTPAHGEHIIGRCKRCGETRDFTELQEQNMGYRQICLADTLTRPQVDMSRIMLVKKPKKHKRELSRGRVR